MGLGAPGAHLGLWGRKERLGGRAGRRRGAEHPKLPSHWGWGRAGPPWRGTHPGDTSQGRVGVHGAVSLPCGVTFGAAAGKSPWEAAGASGCPWQLLCGAAAISAARRPAPPHPHPKMSPGLEDSLCRVFQEKLQLWTVPAGDSVSLLPSSTRLLLKRRELVEVEGALRAQREGFGRRMEDLDRRRQRLGQRAEQLRDVALSFDAFLKVSAARRERARVAWRGTDADGLQQELAGLLRRRERLRRRLQGLQVFGEYLRGVVATTGRFQDVPSMLAHFGALVGVRAALLQQLEAGQQRLAQGRARLQRYHEESGGELLQGRDEVLQLRARLEAARHDVFQGESCWTQIQSAAAHKALLLGQIRMAVLSLFQLATKHLRVPRDVALEDTETQLDMVLLCLQDLAAICAELRPKEPGLGLTTTTRPRHHRAVTGPPSHQ
ncbi:cilia- and flagella-associated protein 73 isoform X2 [Anas platyrhynchos]|uniref:cilia- and flagella-associated protein 73 isoform X2 n=1 Tax=Anas platyrhynchos TaxID=8839 RepID=UPI000F7CD3AB|eukprot:XP_027326112.1 cilia- and flagella-associated protein 73 isoform X1 [Anas platyrhynchos]